MARFRHCRFVHERAIDEDEQRGPQQYRGRWKRPPSQRAWFLRRLDAIEDALQ